MDTLPVIPNAPQRGFILQAREHISQCWWRATIFRRNCGPESLTLDFRMLLRAADWRCAAALVFHFIAAAAKVVCSSATHMSNDTATMALVPAMGGSRSTCTGCE